MYRMLLIKLLINTGVIYTSYNTQYKYCIINTDGVAPLWRIVAGTRLAQALYAEGLEVSRAIDPGVALTEQTHWAPQSPVWGSRWPCLTPGIPLPLGAAGTTSKCFCRRDTMTQPTHVSMGWAGDPPARWGRLADSDCEPPNKPFSARLIVW